MDPQISCSAEHDRCENDSGPPKKGIQITDQCRKSKAANQERNCNGNSDGQAVGYFRIGSKASGNPENVANGGGHNFAPNHDPIEYLGDRNAPLHAIKAPPA